MQVNLITLGRVALAMLRALPRPFLKQGLRAGPNGDVPFGPGSIEITLRFEYVGRQEDGKVEIVRASTVEREQPDGFAVAAKAVQKEMQQTNPDPASPPITPRGHRTPGPILGIPGAGKR